MSDDSPSTIPIRTMSAGLPLKVAVIGVGALGRHHARILGTLTDVELVAVVDADAAQARKIAATIPCGWTTDYRELLGRIDAAVIATPTFLHRPIGTDLLEAGVPLLVEKPLAASLADATALTDLAAARGLTLQVGHVERFNPAYEAVKASVEDPKYVRTERFSPFAFRSTDIGVVHDLMIHDLDLLLDLVGPTAEVTSVDAFGVSVLGGHEDTAQARIKFDSGCVADVVVNRVNPEPRRAIQVWSEHGCVSADLTSREVTTLGAPSGEPSPLELAGRPGADIAALKETIFGEYIGRETVQADAVDQLTAELKEFVDCVTTGAMPRCGGWEAKRSLGLADAVMASIEAHQWDGRSDGRIGPRAFTQDHAARRAA
ncbi:MAG: Gfo/Idh/MocA family oxidoreductase [Planctomycetota bacterium]